MKKAFYEVPVFIVVILIALAFIGKNFNKGPSISLSNFTLNEIATCTDISRCIQQASVPDKRKNKSASMKEIKNFLRQQIY
ncbi:hypothetical protein KDV38_00110 [Providencia rettgeri]